MKKLNHISLRMALCVSLILCVFLMTADISHGIPSNLLRGFEQGDTAVYKHSGYLKGSDGKYYTGQINNSKRYAYGIFDRKENVVRRLYCVDRTKLNPSSGSDRYTARGIGALSDLSEGQKSGIMAALLYGRQLGFGEGKLEEVLGITRGNGDDWWIATQSIIWEFSGGYRSGPASIPKNVGPNNLGTRAAEGKSKNFMYNYVKGRPAEAIYFAMLEKIRDHRKIPSFTAKYEDRARNKIIYMEKCDDGVWRSIDPDYAVSMTLEERAAARQDPDYHTITDRNSIGSEIFVPDSNDGKNENYKFIKTGENTYVLEFYGTDLPDPARRVKKDNVVETDKNSLLIWTKSGYQPLAMGAYDDVESFFTMEELSEDGTIPIPPEPGEPQELPPPPEPELPSFELSVEKTDKNPGWDSSSGTSHTPMGEAGLDSVIGLFIDDSLYDEAALDIYGHQNEPFFFMPWGSLSELDLEESTYEGTDGDGNIITYTRHTYTGTRSVKTEETSVPSGRHTESASGTGNGTRDHGTITYQAVCTNEPGNEGPRYNITYKGENGNVTTVNNGGSVDPGTPFVMYGAVGSNAYVNDNYRGTLQIIKTKDDRDPFTEKNQDEGVKDFSLSSRWTVKLVDDGYEDCPYVRVVRASPGSPGYDESASTYRATRDDSGTCADEDAPLVPSSYGQIKILDLPYGTYEVREILADDPGYVLETFYVTVSAHGQLISKEVNNRAISNKIKLIKTNSQTGKPVRWDGERTAFRIRYKGDPDLADPTSAPNYNRFLPNGSGYSDENGNYVFYADKNGEIVLPYEIEYGIYELQELTVPEGYYVGRYDDEGIGTVAHMGDLVIKDHRGQMVTPPASFTESVCVADENGDPVTEFDGNSETTYNTYSFTVTEQDVHIDGNDYVTYYANIDIPNDPVRGRLRLMKTGEFLAGWMPPAGTEDGLWTPLWAPGPLSDARFEIYAAGDIIENDGTPSVAPYFSHNDTPVELSPISRDHSLAADPKQTEEIVLPGGDIIKRQQGRSISPDNKVVTEYITGGISGARCKQTFVVRDEEKKISYRYAAEYHMVNSADGLSYTDVHIKKVSVADDYVPEIGTTLPQLSSGGNDLDFVTMTYDGGNMVEMIPLENVSADPEEGPSGIYSGYDDSAVDVETVAPKEGDIVVINDPEEETPGGLHEDGTGRKIVFPSSWDRAEDPHTGQPHADKYMAAKDREYRILVLDKDGKGRWISCDEKGVFHISYIQEYSFSLIRHDESPDGFLFEWDDVLSMESALDPEDDSAITVISSPRESKDDIYTSPSYSHEISTDPDMPGKKRMIFTGTSDNEAPVYFETRDGIRTYMTFSGGSSHTTLMVPQSSLKVFDKAFPVIDYGSGENFQMGESTGETTVSWSDCIDPAVGKFEKVFDARNYIRAKRVEITPDDDEVRYVIEMVSNKQNSDDGFVITYPDGGTCAPTVGADGENAVLTFESPAATMVYPAGKPVETIHTGDDGVALSSLLPLGDYWVRETASTAGHVNSGAWKKFTLSYEDQYTPLVWDGVEYENEAISLCLNIEKLFETGYGSGKYGPGNGALFGVYAGEDIGDDTGENNDDTVSLLPEGSPVAEGQVTDGTLLIKTKLPPGKYYIEEISPPDGYERDRGKYYFDVTDPVVAGKISFDDSSQGLSGSVYHTGDDSLMLDMDLLCRYPPSTVRIGNKEYLTDQDSSDDRVSVKVLDGRTNFLVKVCKGESVEVAPQEDSSILLTCYGRRYDATFTGFDREMMDEHIFTSPFFEVTEDEGQGALSLEFVPRVSHTGFYSAVAYPYISAENDDSHDHENSHPENHETLILRSPLSDCRIKAVLDKVRHRISVEPEGDVMKICSSDTDLSTYEDLLLDPSSAPVTVEFGDGTSFSISMGENCMVYMDCRGLTDGDVRLADLFTVTGNDDIPGEVIVRNVKAETYVRNSTDSNMLEVDVKGIKNRKLPDVPDIPYIPPTPEDPVIPDEPDVPDEPDGPDVPDEPVLSDKKGSLIIRKVDSETAAPLAGARFVISDDEGDVIHRGLTSQNGLIRIHGLEPGLYHYRETKAPEGYVKDREIYSFMITAHEGTGDVVEIQAGNEKTPAENGTRILGPVSPKTGDDRFPVMAFLFLAVSALIMTYIISRRNDRS